MIFPIVPCIDVAIVVNTPIVWPVACVAAVYNCVKAVGNNPVILVRLPLIEVHIVEKAADASDVVQLSLGF